MRVDVVPVGGPDGSLLEVSREVLREKYEAEVNIHSGVPVPNDAYSSDKGQYNAERFIEICNRVGGGDKNITITPHDLYFRKRNYVFGLAYLEGQGCVVSTHRLKMTTDGGRVESDGKVADRVRKEVVHEVGHTLGMEHCDNKMCVMSFSPTVSEVDRKFERTCAKCDPGV
ncbi:MAG: archaemetzincin family Zn-dependent metalloprotease [Halobacteria archaeon]